MNKHNKIQTSVTQQYLGYCETPTLWSNDSIYNLNQFKELKHKSDSSIFTKHHLPKRLGKRIEHFVFNDINQDTELTLLAQNLQIQHDKQTIGELDALLLVQNQPVHLEIIYKFYLYDPLLGPQELNCWIGPNRNDSLIQKLNKLKNKQMPLLQHLQTQHYLNDLNLNVTAIRQQVLFKAQLFLPETTDLWPNTLLNKACIVGTYFKKEHLLSLSHCQFYLPTKLEWIIGAHEYVSWLTSDLFFKELAICFNNKKSPLVWIKYPNQVLKRCFMVWW